MSKKNRMKKSELEFMEDVDEINYWNESNLSIAERKEIEETDNVQFNNIGGALIRMLAESNQFMVWVNKQLADMPPAELNCGAGSMHGIAFSKADVVTMINISNILRVAPLVTRKQFYDQVEKCFHGSIVKAKKCNCFIEFIKDKMNENIYVMIKRYIYFSIANRDEYGRLKDFKYTETEEEYGEKEANVLEEIVTNINGLNLRCNDLSFGRPAGILKELANTIVNKICTNNVSALFNAAGIGIEMEPYMAIMTAEHILYPDIVKVKITDNELKQLVDTNMRLSAEKYIKDNHLDKDKKGYYNYTFEEINKIIADKLTNILKSNDDKYNVTDTTVDTAKKQMCSNILANKNDLFKNTSDSIYSVSSLLHGPCGEHINPAIGKAINELYTVCLNGTIRSMLMLKVMKMVNIGKTSVAKVMKDNASFYKKHKLVTVDVTANEVEELRKLVDKKQQSLNEMQLECDRLKKKLADVEEENRILKLENDDDEVYNEVEESGEPEIEEKVYPKNTILIGGHPNWLKQFKAHYPDVKVYDGDASVNANAITSKTPLVLINTTYMCHAAYHKVKNRLNDIGTKWEYIYPCYRGAANMNSVSK